jgi:hypothetical protein
MKGRTFKLGSNVQYRSEFLFQTVKDPGKVEHVIEQHSGHREQISTKHNQRNANSRCYFNRAQAFTLALGLGLIVHRMNHAKRFGRIGILHGCHGSHRVIN